MSSPLASPVESLLLTLESEEHEADAQAVAASLHALVVLVDETNQALQSKAQVRVRVRAFEKGSLEVPFDLVALAVGTLFADGAATTLSQILAVVKEYLNVKKLLKGKSVDEAPISTASIIENLTIHGDNNQVILNVVQNSQVNEAVGRAFDALEADKSVERVKLTRPETGEELISIDRNDFKYLRSPEDEIVEPPPVRVRLEIVTLVLHTPALEGKAKWKFILNSNTIQASIQDSRFLAKVRSRIERFGAGDKLRVELEISEERDPKSGEYLANGQYIVRKVIKHTALPPKKQPPQLFPDEDEE